MKRVLAKEIVPELDGKDVMLEGWIHEIRNLSKIKFVLLRDWSGIIQCVALKGSIADKLFDSIPTIPIESVVRIEGTAKANKEARKGVEVQIKNIEVLNKAEPLPITVTEKGISIALPKRLDFRSIDLRKPNNNAIFKIQSALAEGMQKYLNSEGFIQVFTPCLMGAASESGAEVFRMKYFNTEATLRQDPQLHRQLTIAGGFERIYDLGPSWRAELSHTVRHLCEHRTCAAEMAFIKDEQDVMRLEENVVVAALRNVKEKCKDELELLGIKITIPETPFLELRFPKIYDILEKMGKKIPHGEDLDTEANDLLWEYVQKKHKCEFYFFNRFPSEAKPFYVKRVDEEPEWAHSVDLNCKGIELSSGGQREHRYEKLMEVIKEKKMNAKNLEWFTQFFKWGVPPHGGWALGIERFTQALLNLENVQQATLFPRTPDRLLP